MGPAIKLVSALLVVLALGALQIAAPSFNPAPEAPIQANQSNNNKEVIELPANTGSWQVANYQEAERGSLFFLAEESTSDGVYTLSPSLKTDVKINVTGVVARTQLSQTFRNDSKEWLNALYVFPLPENAAIDHLQMQIGERIIEGQIKEKNQAKKIYEQAKQAGKKASLIVQQRPNLFTNSIANIGPGETIVVTIEYQQTLAYEQAAYHLRFPMTLTPRYNPPASEANEELANDVQAIYSAPDNLEEDINIEVIIHTGHAGFAINKIHSESHAIDTTQEAEGDYIIRLAKQTIANQDFVLSWKPELGNTPKIAHFQQNVNGQQFGLLMIYPPDPATPTKQEIELDREVIFVLDTSGSMSGESLNQAKRALLLALSELKAKDRFNVIEFNSYAQNLWQDSKPATLAAITEARNFIVNLSANGGTEMASALNLALEQQDKQAAAGIRQVVFITDGSVGNEESLMSLISEKLHNSRLFTVGIGSAPNSYFMTEAALMGKGTYTYIGAIEQVQSKMQALLTKLANPALTDIQLMINNEVANLQTDIEFYPRVISDLYLGEPLVLSYRQSTPDIAQANLSLQGRYQQAPWALPITTSQSNRQSGLNVLWAREKISQLSRDQRKAAMDNIESTQAEYFKQQIIQTALQHHLVSQYTSLVAVDVTPSKPTSSQAYNQQVTNRIPQGNTQNPLAHLPQTATAAELKILIGALLIGVALCIQFMMRRKKPALTC
ncbi:marine proteobacterial sortase target protein [Paraglaciecola sp.]|uniref:marine proteobacterial sortase target protein n=1 Tax=Paraglaciecola sp. TaxID=1920173 RepID=UPI0030F44ECF